MLGQLSSKPISVPKAPNFKSRYYPVKNTGSSQRSLCLPKVYFPLSSLSGLYAWRITLEKVGVGNAAPIKFYILSVICIFEVRISLHNVFVFADVEYLSLR